MTTLPHIKRMIQAAIRAARQEGVSVPYVEVTVDGATIRIPLAPDDKPIAEPDEIIL